jgi:hypothetical protein
MYAKSAVEKEIASLEYGRSKKRYPPNKTQAYPITASNFDHVE